MNPFPKAQSKNVPEERSDATSFDHWAPHYDRSVRSSPETFPFAGYEQVSDEIIRRADVKPSLRILDLGTGTGNLVERFIELGCNVWGLDFSGKMLAQAKEKCPHATFLQADLHGDWPSFFDHRFDRVVSAYAFHHFDLSTKVRLIEQAIPLLEAHGRIVIGDIAFETAAARQQAHKQWNDLWDDTEHYWAKDETTAPLDKSGFCTTYTQVSFCGGVFVVERRG
jgi:putative AdoMet-dependent methyltransferase